jgi:hypothetical protein
MKKLILLSFFLFVNGAFAQQSPRQQQAVNLFEFVRVFLRACLYSDQCSMTPEQRELTQKIVDNDERGYYSKKSIVFKSGKENPEAFESSLGESHRTMMTGNKPDSPIIVNTDRLEDMTTLLSPENIMAFFAHELVHHLGYADDAKRIPDQYAIFIAETLHSRISTQYFADGAIEYFMLSFPQPISTDGRRAFPYGIFPSVLIRTPRGNLGGNLKQIAAQGPEFCGGNEIWSAEGQFLNRKVISKNGDIETSFLTYKMMARCHSVSENALQEVIFKMDSNVVINTRTQEAVNASFNFTRTSSDPTNEQALTIVNVTHPDTVRAGTQLTVVAEVSSRWRLDVTGCEVAMVSPTWRGHEENLPLTANSISCRFLELGTNSAKIEATFDVPANAPDGLVLQPKMIGLVLRSSGQYSVGLPSKTTEVRVSGNPAPATRVASVIVVDSTGTQITPSNGVYTLSRQKSYYLGFQTEGVTTAVEGFITYTALDANSNQMYKPNHLLHAEPVKWVRGGFYYPIQMSERGGTVQMRNHIYLQMGFFDTNWNYIFADLTAFNLKIEIRD